MACFANIQMTVNTQGEAIRVLTQENGILKMLTMENAHLKQALESQSQRISQLEEALKECKRSCVDVGTLQERLSNVEHEHVTKTAKLESMSRDVCEMRTKTWADVCKEKGTNEQENALHTKYVKNGETIDVQEMQEREKRSRNVVIRGIKEQSDETPTSLATNIEGFLSSHFGMSGIAVYGARRVGKQGAPCSGDRPLVCTMLDESKRSIILDNSWVYLKGTGCFVCEDRTLQQQSARRKAYEERQERLKGTNKPPPKDPPEHT